MSRPPLVRFNPLPAGVLLPAGSTAPTPPATKETLVKARRLLGAIKLLADDRSRIPLITMVYVTPSVCAAVVRVTVAPSPARLAVLTSRVAPEELVRAELRM